MRSEISGTIPEFVYVPPMEPFLDVIHHDEAILVLSKQSGLLSVPGKAVEHRDSLETRAQSQFPDALTVHRLDRGTSGVVVMGLGKGPHRHLSLQFQKRMTAKTYIAEIWGCPGGEAGVIELPLRCDWPNRPLQIVDHDLGKPAVTYWKILSSDGRTSRIELKPVTGRSHQLRVHMKELGHPILGDGFYAPTEAQSAAKRLLLHAQELTIRHPGDGRPVTFIDPCPF